MAGKVLMGKPGLCWLLVLTLAAPCFAAQPEGYLDVANSNLIAGWALDADYDGPIPVHIYVDGALVQAVLADDYREDVGAHGFNWVPPPFGAGNHEVIAFGIGVNSAGVSNGQNQGLTNSPKYINSGCQGLAGSALGWCEGNPAYWINRQADTELIGNDTVRIGVNRSYGGSIFQLYGPDWKDNLILEHGGAAIQLSIWGYDCPSPSAWFSTDSCDSTPYGSKNACLAAGHSACVARGCAQGDHVLDCASATPCVGWSAGAPWNPIQAQGSDCWWDNAGNDTVHDKWTDDTYYTRHENPYHFTSTLPPVAGMKMRQWVTLHQGYAEVKYRLTYEGSATWSKHPQEIPAIFTSKNMDKHYYYYGGDDSFSGDSVTHVSGPSDEFVRFPGQSEYGHDNNFMGYVNEGWWGVCDGPKEHCVTVASFDPVMNEVSLSGSSNNEGYITALGYFNVKPGLDLQWTVYFFPYRYDKVIDGSTVRQIIYGLAPQAFKQLTQCSPACAGKECGGDGCGGSCGSCPAEYTCNGGSCQAPPPDPDVVSPDPDVVSPAPDIVSPGPDLVAEVAEETMEAEVVEIVPVVELETVADVPTVQPDQASPPLVPEKEGEVVGSEIWGPKPDWSEDEVGTGGGPVIGPDLTPGSGQPSSGCQAGPGRNSFTPLLLLAFVALMAVWGRAREGEKPVQ